MKHFNKIHQFFFLKIIIITAIISFSAIPKNIRAKCAIGNEIEFSDIPNYKEGELKTKSSFVDGRYYEWIIEFNGGIRGRLFQGGNSLRFFIEDTTGTNYFYRDKKSALRALYIYKKYNCISTKYK